MTREAAIINLKMIEIAFIEHVTEEQQKLIHDTFKMAIKSLEAWRKVKSDIVDDIAERTKRLDEHNQEDLRELVGLTYALSVVVEHLQEDEE